MKNSKEIGNIGETVAIAELTKLGIPVLVPIGDNLRYDLVFELNSELWKVQVKTCEKSNNGICSFLCQSKRNHTTNKKLSVYSNDVDYFIYYCIELNLLAIVPISVIGNNKTFNLRLNESPNRGVKNVHYFKDFTLERILKN